MFEDVIDDLRGIADVADIVANDVPESDSWITSDWYHGFASGLREAVLRLEEEEERSAPQRESVLSPETRLGDSAAAPSVLEPHPFAPYPRSGYRSCVRCGRLPENAIHTVAVEQPNDRVRAYYRSLRRVFNQLED